jgi:arsenite methyltransferase
VRSSLLEQLVDPETKEPLELTGSPRENGEIVEGGLRSGTGAEYPIVRGIPRFTIDREEAQTQTSESFGFKWEQRHTYESSKVLDWSRQWVLDRYGFESLDEMRTFFAGQERILDAGCGGGFTTSLWIDPDWRGGGEAEWVGLDISTAIDVARDRLAGIDGLHFVQADVLHLPFREGTFSSVFSEGVLHHTPSTEAALRSASSVLAEGGELLFYVYRKKGAIREFSDDYVRDALSQLGPEEAWQALEPLTQLGRALAELDVTVDVPEEIPLLGIPAGPQNLQRLVYWHFWKLYWNESFTADENNLVNFDWYHPRYAHRQTEEELRGWCADLGLSILHLDAQESGFTVRARKG